MRNFLGIEAYWRTNTQQQENWLLCRTFSKSEYFLSDLAKKFWEWWVFSSSPYLFSMSIFFYQVWRKEAREKHKVSPHKLIDWNQKGGGEDIFQKAYMYPTLLSSIKKFSSKFQWQHSRWDFLQYISHAHLSIYYYPVCIEKCIRKWNICLLTML